MFSSSMTSISVPAAAVIVMVFSDSTDVPDAGSSVYSKVSALAVVAAKLVVIAAIAKVVNSFFINEKFF